MALFPAIEPFMTGYLPVDDIHTLYYEQSGNPDGVPVVLLHGGPGAEPSGNIRRFHNPQRYRIILLHQRGTGKSTPHACIKQNTTQLLISDLESLRSTLAIDTWHVFGGSWGSTLALAYAQCHPHRVLSLVLRGLFLCRPFELQWFYNQSYLIFPDYFAEYEAILPPAERKDRIKAFHPYLNDPDPKVHMPAARAWSAFEVKACTLEPTEDYKSFLTNDKLALAMARIENHYFVNHIFLPEDHLLQSMPKLFDIPVKMVHGRYDIVCPVKTAFDVKAALPHAELTVVPTGSHSPFEAPMADALVHYTNSLL